MGLQKYLVRSLIRHFISFYFVKDLFQTLYHQIMYGKIQAF